MARSGIGALVLRSDVVPRPLLFGGFQQDLLRPGTESPALVVGMCAVLEAWYRRAQEQAARLAGSRDELELRLRTAHPEFVIHGSGVPRLPQRSTSRGRS